jgi:hypothetical protein
VLDAKTDSIGFYKGMNETAAGFAVLSLMTFNKETKEHESECVLLNIDDCNEWGDKHITFIENSNSKS